MNSVLCTPSPNPHHLSPFRVPRAAMPTPIISASSRKRKADDEEYRQDDRMSASPSNSPQIASESLPAHRSIKRPRSGLVGRPLALPRLLETLDAESLRGVLKSICEHHPLIGSEVVKSAPRPSVVSALQVLKDYETRLRNAFPIGSNSTDYAYNRVRQPLLALLEALSDFTPHFLPPNETQTNESLSFLDAATEVIHHLPDWDSFANTLHKSEAYEEMAKAWAVVLREAAKRAGGIQLQYGGWDQKLAKHNQQSQGKLQEAVDELASILGWMVRQPSNNQHTPRPDGGLNIRQELLSGTYGLSMPVRVGPW